MANPRNSQIPDPMQWWRAAFDHVENSVNTLGARHMESEQFSQALNQFSQVSLGMQHVFGQALAGVLKRLDLPSRTEVAELAAAVRRVEDKLDMLLPAASRPSTAPRPARTRRPPQDAQPTQLATASPPAAPLPAKRASGRSRKAAKP